MARGAGHTEGRWAGAVLLLLVAAILLAGCAENTPGPWNQASPLATVAVGDSYLSVLPTATAPLPTQPVPSSSPESSPWRLVLLHTNDNWGETEPCG